MATGRKKIVILGGGFAGLRTALLLARRLPLHQADIALVDASPYHALRPKLPQAVGGRIACSVHVPFSDILRGKNVRFVHDRVTGVDPDGRGVSLENGRLDAHYIVVALGAQGKAPEAAAGALPVWTFGQACHIRVLLGGLLANSLEEAGTRTPTEARHVVVIGGGFVGVEVAAEIQHKLQRTGAAAKGVRTIVVERRARLLPRLPKGAAALAARRLQQLGAQIVLGNSVLRTGEGSVELEGGERLPAGLVVWAGGVDLSAPAPVAHFADESGRIAVDAHMRTLVNPRVYGAGDAVYVARVEGDHAEPSVLRAETQARVVADNILADMGQGAPRLFRPVTPKYNVGLGPGFGVLAAPPAPVWAGFLPALLKEGLIAKHLLGIGGFALARQWWRPVVTAALSAQYWDGAPLHEGNVLCRHG